MVKTQLMLKYPNIYYIGSLVYLWVRLDKFICLEPHIKPAIFNITNFFLPYY